jgi:2-methylfumaryl-CoA isomerase
MTAPCGRLVRSGAGGRASFAQMGRLPVKRAPILGEHTEEILGEVMGLSDREIGDLFDRGVAAGPKRAVA